MVTAQDILDWIEREKLNVGEGGGNLVVAMLVIKQAIRELGEEERERKEGPGFRGDGFW
jgi:hypothetical protein